MAEEDSFRLDFNAPDFIADPYPIYRYLRAEDPVHESPWDDWYLSRFSDVAMILSDPRFCRQPESGVNPFTCRQRESTPVDGMFNNWMVFMDPPGHTRLRGLVGGFFSQKRIEAMTPSIQDTIDGLLGKVMENGSMDVIADLAYPLPVMVISGMLGVPMEDHALFKDALRDLTKAADSGSDKDFNASAPAAEMLTGYFRDLVTERRKNPRQDIVSALIGVQERDKAISEEELLATCVLLLWAGHETTKNLIGNALFVLLRNPGHMDILSHDPGLIKRAVEEFLRFESPVQKVCRWTSEDVLIDGKTIPGGRLVVGLLGSAHRDPERFADPDRLDFDRIDSGHMAFGRGIHHCIGNILGRIEAQTAINTVLRRMHSIELQTEEPEWQQISSFRALKTLPVTFQTA